MAETASFLDRHHFLLRRLHSLTGIVPIGVFLVAHLTTNSSILWGKIGLRADGQGMGLTEGGVTYFQKEVEWINTQIPHLLLIELVLWISIAFHSALGVVYARQAKNNLKRYPHQDNWRYALQRFSGYFGILFIFYHVATLRWGWSFLVPPFDNSVPWSHNFSSSTLAASLRGSWEEFTIWGLLVSLFYFAGVSLLVFHFANGLWSAAITWGITVSTNAQKRWGVACFGLGAGLMIAGWSSVVGFAMLNPLDAKKYEMKYHQKHGNDIAPLVIPGLSPAANPATSAVPTP